MQIVLHACDLPDQSLLTAKEIAVDTETMGLELHRDRLCLVQLAGENGEIHLVQILKDQRPPRNLIALLGCREILKIFHFARFDVAILLHNLGVVTAPIFCTKIASKLVRTFADRHGLKDLCKDLLKVELSKHEQTSDWGAPVLTEEQQKYAAHDVLYLHKLKRVLEGLLQREDRLDLAQAAFDFLPYRAKLDILAGYDYDILGH